MPTASPADSAPSYSHAARGSRGSPADYTRAKAAKTAASQASQAVTWELRQLKFPPGDGCYAGASIGALAGIEHPSYRPTDGRNVRRAAARVAKVDSSMDMETLMISAFDLPTTAVVDVYALVHVLRAVHQDAPRLFSWPNDREKHRTLGGEGWQVPRSRPSKTGRRTTSGDSSSSSRPRSGHVRERSPPEPSSGASSSERSSHHVEAARRSKHLPPPGAPVIAPPTAKAPTSRRAVAPPVAFSKPAPSSRRNGGVLESKGTRGQVPSLNDLISRDNSIAPLRDISRADCEAAPLRDFSRVAFSDAVLPVCRTNNALTGGVPALIKNELPDPVSASIQMMLCAHLLLWLMMPLSRFRPP